MYSEYLIQLIFDLLGIDTNHYTAIPTNTITSIHTHMVLPFSPGRVAPGFSYTSNKDHFDSLLLDFTSLSESKVYFILLSLRLFTSYCCIKLT